MAQIKVIKINADGFQEEHGTADDVLFATVTAATELAVTSGCTITSNIAFNAVTDTIAGIQNQNLVDKSATETISGNWTIAAGYDLILTDAPTNNTDAANKAYVDSVATGLDWQDSVLDIQVDATLDPGATPTTGDRYILEDVTNLHANFGTITGVGDDDIVEYNGSAFIISWDASVEGEGGAAWVEDVDTAYIFNGSAWVKMAGIFNHNDLANIQGGTSSEYYHMTSAEDTWLATVVADIAAANVADLSDNETVTGDWTFNGTVDVANGEFTFPNAASASPAEGDSYWDGTADILYVYDGSTWVNVAAAGTATSVVTTYTAGAGGISQYDAVYISAADTVLKADSSATATSLTIGFAPLAISAASSGYIQENGKLSGVLTGATAGDTYFLGTTPGQVQNTPPSGVGNNVVRVGYAKNSTDLQIQIQFMGIRA